ncbi:MAG: peptidase MA family metallohydrolase [Chloroflexota bacterium]
MSARRASAPVRLALALLTAAALLLPAVPVHAATFTFSKPDASSKFNTGIDFTIDFEGLDAPSRVETQVLFPGATGPFIETLKRTPTAGHQTLTYTLKTSGSGHLMPNTPITVTWVAYPAGGGDPVTSEPFTYRYLDETQDWKTLKDDLVTVHWTTGPQSFAQNAAKIALDAIKNGAKALGQSETKAVDFFIYADDASFRAALGPGARENVGGEAITETRTLFAEFTPDMLSDPWVGITITHELTHQIIDDATSNPYRSLPRWLNEGFAVYMSEGTPPSTARW